MDKRSSRNGRIPSTEAIHLPLSTATAPATCDSSSGPRGPAKPPRRSKRLPTQRGPTIGASMLWWDAPSYQTTLTSPDFPCNGFLVENRKKGKIGRCRITTSGESRTGRRGQLFHVLQPDASATTTHVFVERTARIGSLRPLLKCPFRPRVAVIASPSANGGPTDAARSTPRTTPGCRPPPRRTGWRKRQA